MRAKYQYKKGYEFYLNTTNNNFVKAKIIKRERKDHIFYYLDIEGRKPGWYTETFISACAFTEEEMLKRLNERK